MPKYIYNGTTHSDYTKTYMQNLGMDNDQIESVENQRDFEIAQNSVKREIAYSKETDKLGAEALRKYFSGDTEGYEAAKAEQLEKVASIQARYPVW